MIIWGLKQNEFAKLPKKKSMKTLEVPKHRFEKYINMEEVLKAKNEANKEEEQSRKKEMGPFFSDP